jgi:hypothetical protein
LFIVINIFGGDRLCSVEAIGKKSFILSIFILEPASVFNESSINLDVVDISHYRPDLFYKIITIFFQIVIVIISVLLAVFVDSSNLKSEK